VLGNPIVIGLTATPPDRDGKDERDVKRYDEFFGEVDFEVPVPAVVKDGFLAPYQDLAYFVRPTTEELKFIASADQQLEQLVDDICQPGFLVAKVHKFPVRQGILQRRQSQSKLWKPLVRSTG